LEVADAGAHGADHGADAEPGEGRAVAVRGAVPGPEPDDHEAGARRGRQPAGVDRVHGRGPGRGPAALVPGIADVPAREARGIGLTPRRGKKETPGDAGRFAMRGGWISRRD